MPGTMALDVYRGDAQGWTLHLYTDPDATVAYDLTGATAKAEVRAVSGGAVLAILGSAITLPNVVDLTLAAVESAKLPPGRLRWDLQLTFPGGVVRTVVAGPVTVTADITDSTDAVVP